MLNLKKKEKEEEEEFYYSEKYYDDKYEYRHVVLPKEYIKLIPTNHLMSEQEWRALGVKQSHGWVHYMIHEPERHVLLFRRLIQTNNPPSQTNQLLTEKAKYKN